MKEFLEYIGLQGDDLEGLKASFQERFITKEQALNDDEIRKTHFKTAYKGFDNVLERNFSDYIEPDELAKAEKTADKIALLRSKLDAKIQDYQTRLESNKKPTEREAEMLKSIDDLKNQITLKENGIKDWESKYNEAESNFNNELKNIRTSQAFSSEVLSLLTFSDQKDEIWKKGFLNELQGKYLVEHNGEKLIIRNRVDGTPVPNPKKHGEELTPFEVYDQELELMGGKKKLEGNVGGQKQPATQGKHIESKGHPRFQQWVN
jgi:hypothetical protein